MVVLDTDHMSELVRNLVPGKQLEARLAGLIEPKSTTIVTLEELFRGQLAQLARVRDSDRLVETYARAQHVFTVFADWLILPWNDGASARLKQLRTQRLGIGTMDLRIAGIALANGATLLSRNLKDFGRVPELKVEDWLS